MLFLKSKMTIRLPPDCLNIEAWRRSTSDELAAFYQSKSDNSRSKKRLGGVLTVRAHLRPVDVYAYLRARFGEPNGIQNFLRKDDSDNLIHWDFNLKSGNADIYISGASREIMFLLSERLSDQQWRSLIVGLKNDFARVATAKGTITKSFEKFVVFQNKFVSLADVCADLHARIVDSPPYEPYAPSAPTHRTRRAASERVGRNAAQRATALYGDTIKLALLTPVMAEAFINMFILILCRDEIRIDIGRYNAFVRERIPERLAALSSNCFGMQCEIDRTTKAYRAFLQVMNKRNFSTHGNVDPVRDQIETVYFEGKRPLFVVPGDHINRFMDNIERLHNPAEVVRDYVAVHGFLHELKTYLVPRYQEFLNQVISDPYPGYELKAKRVTRILPQHVVISMTQGIRYDDELNVQW
jgi:hypothetical protein